MDWGNFLIPIVTFCVGFIVSEITRRINRAETINFQIFNKRLDVYSKLYSLLNKTYNDLNDLAELIKSDNCSSIEQNNFASIHWQAVAPLLEYLDNNALFISDELIVQCGTTFFPIDDYSEEGVAEYFDELGRGYKAIVLMIKSESGLDKLNKNMKKILGYKHKSEVISYFNSIKKKQK